MSLCRFVYSYPEHKWKNKPLKPLFEQETKMLSDKDATHAFLKLFRLQGTADSAGAKATSSGAYYSAMNDWNERAVEMLSLRFVLYETCAVSPSTQ